MPQSFRRKYDARRWQLELVRGTVREIAFSGQAKEATLDVDGRKIELSVSEGSILISVGDTVLVAGPRGDPVRSYIYYNQTTGSGSLEYARKTSRLTLAIGWLGMLVGLAILMTITLAARREPAFFSTPGMFHVLLYIVSVVGSGAIALFSLFMLIVATYNRKMLALVQSAASGSGAPGR